MKIYMNENSLENVFGMTTINPKKSNLLVAIWSDHQGASRNMKHSKPRVKIGKDTVWVVVSIDQNPKILSKSSGIKSSEMKQIQKGIEYVARNYDLFLNHFNSTDFEYDDEDLFNDLRSRGEYK